mmetsp:Transcript_31693/g.90932  ORF Transcript_31693/g.90932 Transcript_31693/m.90932 type:complete len:251 (+) Transcript_31693:69-821(+)
MHGALLPVHCASHVPPRTCSRRPCAPPSWSRGRERAFGFVPLPPGHDLPAAAPRGHRALTVPRAWSLCAQRTEAVKIAVAQSQAQRGRSSPAPESGGSSVELPEASELLEVAAMGVVLTVVSVEVLARSSWWRTVVTVAVVIMSRAVVVVVLVVVVKAAGWTVTLPIPSGPTKAGLSPSTDSVELRSAEAKLRDLSDAAMAWTVEAAGTTTIQLIRPKIPAGMSERASARPPVSCTAPAGMLRTEAISPT